MMWPSTITDVEPVGENFVTESNNQLADTCSALVDADVPCSEAKVIKPIPCPSTNAPTASPLIPCPASFNAKSSPTELPPEAPTFAPTELPTEAPTFAPTESPTIPP